MKGKEGKWGHKQRLDYLSSPAIDLDISLWNALPFIFTGWRQSLQVNTNSQNKLIQVKTSRWQHADEKRWRQFRTSSRPDLIANSEEIEWRRLESKESRNSRSNLDETNSSLTTIQDLLLHVLTGIRSRRSCSVLVLFCSDSNCCLWCTDIYFPLSCK